MPHAWGGSSRSPGKNAGRLVQEAEARVRSVFARIALALWIVGAAPLAGAGTVVSAPVSSNMTWTEAGSPYWLNDEIEITNGAYLTIQPGVEIQSGPDGRLTVVNGALSAQGTSDRPIVFTGSSGEPSGWGPLKFTAGTINASSILSHVEIRHGHGLVVESSSPTLTDLKIDDNEGPAITVDLRASPVGQRIAASGNTLNGILVPAGEISTDVVWALKGIPYVVAQGTVLVGDRYMSMQVSSELDMQNVMTSRSKRGCDHVCVKKTTMADICRADEELSNVGGWVPSIVTVLNIHPVAVTTAGASIDPCANQTVTVGP